VGGVGRLALRSLVMCLLSRLWIFPLRSFFTLARFSQSLPHHSIFPDRRADPNSLLTRIFCLQPFFFKLLLLLETVV